MAINIQQQLIANSIHTIPGVYCHFFVNELIDMAINVIRISSNGTHHVTFNFHLKTKITSAIVTPIIGTYAKIFQPLFRATISTPNKIMHQTSKITFFRLVIIRHSSFCFIFLICDAWLNL